MNKLGLYIHVPFCRRKCPYCDFYSLAGCENLTDAYCDAVIRNIKDCGGSFDTVYFGGGTPSLLTPKQISAILSAAEIAPDAEISMECNPNSVTADYLHDVRSAGVNRLSFGVQSFDDGELKMLGRLHNSAQAAAAIEAAYSTGFDNISADLMLAVSGQTFESLRRNLDAVSKLPLTHISAYMLKVEEGTPLAADKKLLAQIPDEDDTANMYLETVRLLGANGFAQYEISNFARRGSECRHNLKYWRCGDYLGIGPSAHSCISGKRFTVPRDIDAFIRSPLQETVITDENACGAEERMMLALRLAEGYDAVDAGAYADAVLTTAAPLERAGLLTINGMRITLTAKGFLVSNGIICRLAEAFEQDITE